MCRKRFSSAIRGFYDSNQSKRENLYINLHINVQRTIYNYIYLFYISYLLNLKIRIKFYGINISSAMHYYILTALVTGSICIHNVILYN